MSTARTARVIGILFCILLGLTAQAQASETSLTIVYSSNSYGALTSCPS